MDATAFDGLIAAIDFQYVIIAVITVAAALAGVHVVWRGVRMIGAAIRGA